MEVLNIEKKNLFIFNIFTCRPFIGMHAKAVCQSAGILCSGG